MEPNRDRGRRYEKATKGPSAQGGFGPILYCRPVARRYSCRVRLVGLMGGLSTFKVSMEVL